MSEEEIVEGEHFSKRTKHRFRISNSGFVRNGKVFGGSTACPRQVLLRDHGIERTPEVGSEEWFRREITFAIGHANEAVYRKLLEATNTPFKQEFFVCSPINEDVERAGSIDFITDGVPEEKKAVSSTRQFKKICIDRQPKIENVCQLAGYMLEPQIEADRGNLKYTGTLYHSTTNWKAFPKTFTFSVHLKDNGDFVVDNKALFTVEEILEHQWLCAEMLKTQKVWQGRPEGDGFFDACGLCDWRDACDAYDGKEINTTEAFLARCRGLQVCGSGGKK